MQARKKFYFLFQNPWVLSGLTTGYSATTVLWWRVVCLVAMTFLPLVAQEQRRTIGVRANRRRSIFLMMDVGCWILDLLTTEERRARSVDGEAERVKVGIGG